MLNVSCRTLLSYNIWSDILWGWDSIWWFLLVTPPCVLLRRTSRHGQSLVVSHSSSSSWWNGPWRAHRSLCYALVNNSHGVDPWPLWSLKGSWHALIWLNWRLWGRLSCLTFFNMHLFYSLAMRLFLLLLLVLPKTPQTSLTYYCSVMSLYLFSSSYSAKMYFCNFSFRQT